jgi:hypothetical protein
MSKSAIWKSADLRAAWANAVSPKVVDFVERLAGSNTSSVEQRPSEHASDSGIPMKYIRRLFGELETLRLAVVTRSGPRLAATLRLPVELAPPRAAQWPIWSSELKPHPNLPSKVRQRIYDRDQGICAYCGEWVPFHRAEVDHIYPVKMRGGYDDNNLVVCCRPCNRKKWLYPPGHPRFQYPKWFRGEPVLGVPQIIQKEGRFCLRIETA